MYEHRRTASRHHAVRLARQLFGSRREPKTKLVWQGTHALLRERIETANTAHVPASVLGCDAIHDWARGKTRDARYYGMRCCCTAWQVRPGVDDQHATVSPLRRLLCCAPKVRVDDEVKLAAPSAVAAGLPNQRCAADACGAAENRKITRVVDPARSFTSLLSCTVAVSASAVNAWTLDRTTTKEDAGASSPMKTRESGNTATRPVTGVAAPQAALRKDNSGKQGTEVIAYLVL